METTEEKINDVLIMRVEGRLDTTNYGILETKLMSLLDANETKIIMDCSKMDYISSSGLRVFLMALKKAKLINGRFILAELQETIREIFEIAGFTAIFEIYRSREEALKAVGSRQ